MYWISLQFLCLEEKNPTEIRRERLLELDNCESLESETILCGVGLTCSQLDNPYSELSTQKKLPIFLGFT